MYDDPKLGATGRFPAGAKSRPDDEGELRAALFVERGRVVLAFGAPIGWLSMGADETRALANEMIRIACSIDGKPFELKIGG